MRPHLVPFGPGAPFRPLMWRARAALATAIAVLGGACKDEGPDGPAALAAVAGDGQQGPIGDPLPSALTVTVTSTNGNAVANVPISWQVTAGSAALDKSSGTSTAVGRDSVTVTFGTATGPVTVQASAGNLAPASFTLTAVDACDWRGALAVPGSHAGSLRPFDCGLSDGSRVDFFRTSVPSAEWITLGMTSDSLDTFLWLYSLADYVIAISDDIDYGVITNTAMHVLLPPGDYIVGANSYSAGEVGPYLLTATPASISVAGCDEYWVGWDVALVDAIATTDCVSNWDSTGAEYSDALLLVLHAGQSLTATMTSTAVDAFLRLHYQNGVVASDDDAAGGANARLTFTAATSAVYLLEAATARPGETGAYSLTVSVTPPLASARAAPGNTRLRDTPKQPRPPVAWR